MQNLVYNSHPHTNEKAQTESQNENQINLQKWYLCQSLADWVVKLHRSFVCLFVCCVCLQLVFSLLNSLLLQLIELYKIRKENTQWMKTCCFETVKEATQ